MQEQVQFLKIQRKCLNDVSYPFPYKENIIKSVNLRKEIIEKINKINKIQSFRTYNRNFIKENGMFLIDDNDFCIQFGLNIYQSEYLFVRIIGTETYGHVQFIVIQKGRENIRRIIHTLYFPSVIYDQFKKFVYEMMQNEDINEFDLSYECMCMIDKWLRNLYQNTCGKFYECNEWSQDSEKATQMMLQAFCDYTGLSQEECTDDFRLSLIGFLDSEGGIIQSLMNDMSSVDYQDKVLIRFC